MVNFAIYMKHGVLGPSIPRASSFSISKINSFYANNRGDSKISCYFIIPLLMSGTPLGLNLCIWGYFHLEGELGLQSVTAIIGLSILSLRPLCMKPSAFTEQQALILHR